MTKTKNQGIYSIKRKRTAGKRGIDIEDPYRGNKPRSWTCSVCGSKMVPYKQDAYGDVVLSCTNQNCWKSKDFGGTLTLKLKKLAKQQQMNSRLFYRRYDGGYY